MRGLATVTGCMGLLLAACGAGGGGAVDAASPAAGEPAPPFSLTGSDGRTHSLDDHRGRRAVVLAWFPKAFTGG